MVNPLYISHVVDVFAQALSLAGNQVVNVAGDEVLSIREMADTIGRTLHCAPVYEQVPGVSGGDTVGDTTRMRQTFRLPARLTSFAEGVKTILGD
jgi:nucleoside-diphosphate-sugar epimerase